MVGHLLITAIPLAAATLAALLAAWRRWAPPLAVALAAGIALRLFIAAVAVEDRAQPIDFMYQFTAAIQAVLHHQDPLQLPNAQWHFLPAMAYVNVAEYKLGYLIHLPWQFTGRIAPVTADIVLIPLAGLLAGTGGRRHRAALQYALNPIAVLISAVHAQIEPVALAFGVAALIVARRPRAVPAPQPDPPAPQPDSAVRGADPLAQRPGFRARQARWSPLAVQVSGALLGMAIAINSWPALLIPGLLRALPTWRARLAAMAWTAGIPLLFLGTGPFVIGYPARLLASDIHELATVRGVIGDWGWTAIVTGGNETIGPYWAQRGILILIVVLLAVWYLWRHAHPADLIAALCLAFLAGTDRLGDQYLLWPVPWQAARPTRGTWIWFVLGGAWSAAGELWLAHAPNGIAWHFMHQPWAYSSLAVLPFLVLAMPWRRRAASRVTAGTSGDGERASAPPASYTAPTT